MQRRKKSSAFGPAGTGLGELYLGTSSIAQSIPHTTPNISYDPPKKQSGEKHTLTWQSHVTPLLGEQSWENQKQPNLKPTCFTPRLALWFARLATAEPTVATGAAWLCHPAPSAPRQHQTPFLMAQPNTSGHSNPEGDLFV